MSPWNDMFYLSTSCWASWGPLTPSIVRQKVGVRWPTYPNFGWELGAAPALDRSHHGQWCLAGQQLCWGRVGRYLPHVSWSPCSWRMSEGGVGKARKPVRGFQSSSQIRAFPRARLWAKSSKVLNAGPCTSRIIMYIKLKIHRLTLCQRLIQSLQCQFPTCKPKKESFLRVWLD